METASKLIDSTTKKVPCGAKGCKTTFVVPIEHPGNFYCSIECSVYGKFELKELKELREKEDAIRRT